MKIFLHFLFLCFGIGVSAQNEFSKWYFGGYVGLDFMTVPPSLLNNTTLNSAEGCSTMSDASGNILFYTDGATIWNKQHLVMANGSGLFGSFSTVQSSLIVKQPGNQNIYYVFTLAPQTATNGLRYSIVDMSLASGSGSVTVKNVPVTSPCTEQLTGTRHCNGIDMWIITRDPVGNFHSFLLTAAGLNFTPVTSAIGPLSSHAFNQGTIKVSPTGKKLGMTFFNGTSQVVIFDFDRTSGVISNSLSLMNGGGNFYGCEFSGDGSKFYSASRGAIPAVYQWDLCAGSSPLIFASKTTVGTPPPMMDYNQLQLAPDGKIYICATASPSLPAIQDPNLAGLACNFTPLALSVGTGTAMLGLPNFFSFKNLPSFTYTINPLISCTTVSFSTPAYSTGCAASSYSVQGITWNFGDPQSGTANVSTLNSPTHVYPAPGTYSVKLVFNYQCGSDTIYQAVTVPGPILSVSTNSCASTATLNVSNLSGPYSYTWMPSAQTTSVANVNTGSYTITIKDASTNCLYTIFSQIASFPGPTLAVQSISICPKAKATLTVSGGTSYTWSPGNSTGSTFTASPNATQVYTISSSSASGCKSSVTATITVINCTSINENYQDRILKIYPNPLSTELFIETNEEIALIIYDLAGRMILEEKLEIGIHQINTQAFNGGIYFVKAIGHSNATMKKLIKLN